MPQKSIIRSEDDFSKTIDTFELYFKNKDYESGYSFVCDDAGNICFEDLTPAAQENARQCLAGEKPNYEPAKIRLVHSHIRFCNCGSKQVPHELCDARDIFIAKVCPACVDSVKSKYRDDRLDRK